MKVFVIGLLVFAAILVFAFASNRNINFKPGNSVKEYQGITFIEENWGKVLNEAKKQNKHIFLDAYASWCGPCKLLKTKTFTDKDAGEFFNQNFINAAIDMEKDEGPDLAEKYGVNAFPTLIIADANGNIITYTTGYIKPKQLIEFGKYGLSGWKK